VNLMKTNTGELNRDSTLIHLALDGLPAFLQGGNTPILNLFGHTNQRLREKFIKRFTHSEYWKKRSKHSPKISDDRLLETFYSNQSFRFVSFWIVMSNIPHKPIEFERRSPIPDILVFLLHAYDPECFNATLDESQLDGLDVELIRRNVYTAFAEQQNNIDNIKKEGCLKFLMLWPRLTSDLENLDSKREEDRRRISGAVFALASAFNSPELLFRAIELSGGQLQKEFASLIPMAPIDRNSNSIPIKSWESLVNDLQSLASRLHDDFSNNLLDEIESALAALKEAAADRQTMEADKQWIEQYFSNLKQLCAEHASLVWLEDEIEKTRLSYTQSNIAPTPLKNRLEQVGNDLENDLADYCETTNRISEKKGLLATLETSIAAATPHDRLRLRSEEKACREELNELSDRLFELESFLLVAVSQLLSQTQFPESEAFLPTPELPDTASPEILRPEIQEQPTSVLEVNKPKGPETDSESFISPLQPESLNRPNSELELLPYKSQLETPSAPKPELATQTPTSTPAMPSIKVEIIENKNESITTEPLESPSINRSIDSLLLSLVVNQGELSHEDWIALGQFQRDWLEQRQPLRAWMLADEVERKLALIKKHVEGLALLPSWACRLLLLLSDTKLPLSDEETEWLYKIRTLENEQKELVVLWLTAALLENKTDKPLRIARLISPQQFDLPSHSLALLCAQHLLTLVFNGGSLCPPKDQTEFQRSYDQAIKSAQDIVDPTRNNYQKSWVKLFWSKLIATSGSMGRIFAEAKRYQFPSKTLSVDAIVEELPEWSDIQSSYRHNMQNRMEDFCIQIEKARSAYKSLQEIQKTDKSTISKHAAQAIIEGIQRQTTPGWWFNTIKSGMIEL
jgi:hypothetical protein